MNEKPRLTLTQAAVAVQEPSPDAFTHCALCNRRIATLLFPDHLKNEHGEDPPPGRAA